MPWESPLLCLLCCVLGCSGTEITGAQLAPEQARELQIGSLETGYGEGLAPDRLTRAQQYGLAHRVGDQVELWLTEVGRWGGPDRARIEVTRFRLPEELKYSTLGKLSTTGGFAKLGGRPKWCRELY